MRLIDGRPWVAVDLDGTLLDCRPRQVMALRRILAGEVEFDEDVFWTAKRDGATTAAALVAQGFEDPTARVIARRWVESVEADTVLHADVLHEPAAAALKLMRTAGLGVFVLTARARPDSVRQQVTDLGLDALVDGVEVVEPARAAAEKAAILARGRAIALVGDTESDARAAALARTRFFCVTNGQRSPEFLLRHMPEQLLYPDILEAAKSAVNLAHRS